MIHGGMSCDPIKGQGQGCLKIETKSTSSAGMYAVKKLTVNSDTPRQYLNTVTTDHSASRDFQTSAILHCIVNCQMTIIFIFGSRVGFQGWQIEQHYL